MKIALYIIFVIGLLSLGQWSLAKAATEFPASQSRAGIEFDLSLLLEVAISLKQKEAPHPAEKENASQNTGESSAFGNLGLRFFLEDFALASYGVLADAKHVQAQQVAHPSPAQIGLKDAKSLAIDRIYRRMDQTPDVNGFSSMLSSLNFLYPGLMQRPRPNVLLRREILRAHDFLRLHAGTKSGDIAYDLMELYAGLLSAADYKGFLDEEERQTIATRALMFAFSTDLTREEQYYLANPTVRLIEALQPKTRTIEAPQAILPPANPTPRKAPAADILITVSPDFLEQKKSCGTHDAGAVNPETSARAIMAAALTLIRSGENEKSVQDYIDLAYYHVALVEPAPEGAERAITLPALEDHGPPLPLGAARRLALEVRCKWSRI